MQQLLKRKEALAQGKTYYFTGKPCKQGHIALRRAVNGFCTECEKVKNNTEERKKYMVEYAENNREKIRKIASDWQKQNKGKVNANTAKRHSNKMQRKPKWLTKHDELHIRCLYQVAAMRTRESGQAWHVDHIIPLKGENVSGLHVPWNLRVIPAVDNLKKNNRYHG
jgi:hypothetical protein